MKWPAWKILLYLMALVYVLAGLNHFWHPETYLRIMPEFLPKPLLLVQLSGVAEIILGILLLPVQTRRMAAWGTIFLLIAVFPANIKMAIDFWQNNHPYLWVSLLRMPLQFVLIWWAWKFTKKRETKINVFSA